MNNLTDKQIGDAIGRLWKEYTKDRADERPYWFLESLIPKEKAWSAEDLKEGDEYWYIDDFGDITKSKRSSHRADAFRIHTGNCYETKEKVEEAYKLIMNK